MGDALCGSGVGFQPVLYEGQGGGGKRTAEHVQMVSRAEGRRKTSPFAPCASESEEGSRASRIRWAWALGKGRVHEVVDSAAAVDPFAAAEVVDSFAAAEVVNSFATAAAAAAVTVGVISADGEPRTRLAGGDEASAAEECERARLCPTG